MTELTKHDTNLIESLAFHSMNLTGYTPMCSHGGIKPTAFQKRYWQYKDAFNYLKSHIKDKVLLKGLDYFLKLHNQSSWR